MRNAPKARRGFTLIEILLVLAIIIMIASVAIVALLPQRERARLDAAKVLVSQVEQALDAYSLNVGHYPTEEEGSLQALLVKPTFESEAMAARWAGPYLKQQPMDPWDNLVNYQLSEAGTMEEGQTKSYKLWSNGPDGMDGTEDDIKNWSDTTAAP